MSIAWAYGIVTVPSRIASGMLQRTIESLANGGFTNPRLFIDGLPGLELMTFGSFEVSCRTTPIRIYGNFHLGLSELHIRNPQADRYAMFQDDMITYKNLRAYLETVEYPAKSYLNLYTFKENEKPQQGFYLSNQLGKGSVALVFSNDAVRALLKNVYWISRPISGEKRWALVDDGAIVTAMGQEGYKEYVHNPSLVQHVGEKSTLGNGRHAQARTFKGESFDAMHLIKAPVSVTERLKARIGLVGYNIITDGTRRIAEHADIYRWLVRPHPTLGMLKLPEDVDCITCPVGHKIDEFLRTVDIVVFLEKPCYDDLLELCGRHHKQVVCVPPGYRFPSDAEGWKQFDEQIRLNSLTEQMYESKRQLQPA